MKLVKWSPLRHMLDRPGDMGYLFRFDLGFPGEGLEWGMWSPALDVYERNGDVIVKSEIPGISEKELEVILDDGILTIKGERNLEEEVKEEDYYRIERAYGAFQRRVRVPAGVDPEKIKAFYADGVLEVKIPRAEMEEPKRIKVKAKEKS